MLAGTLFVLAQPHTAVPGLYYDEAHCAGMAKDFLTGRAHPHMPGSGLLGACDCRFPMFVQSYGGAVKSWLLLPSFAAFGATVPVLRLTALGFGLVALLLFMLWTWRWLGRTTALLAGALLALDPTYFFINTFDWGPVFPSFLARFACFYCALRWWQIRGKPRGFREPLLAFCAGLFAGLGFFNKIDFAVILAGVLLALLCCNARRVWEHLASRRRSTLTRPLALASLGFLLTAGPMLTHVPGILKNDLPDEGNPVEAQRELTEKIDTMLAMYDGTYFYRLMDAGGSFDEMYRTRPPVFAPLGIAFALSAALLLLRSRSADRGAARNAAAVLLLSAAFITIGVLLLPRAVRIHHWVSVYPFPHLVVASAVTGLWRGRQRAVVAALVAALLGSQLLVLHRTQQLITETGGRGWWSDALNEFAREVRDRADLTIVSLDWGFNEQLAFLTDGPTLIEPIWGSEPPLSLAPNVVYLVHPPEYTLRPAGLAHFEAVRSAGADAAEVREWRDRRGEVAFYSLQFRER